MRSQNVTVESQPAAPMRSPDRFFIGGEWVAPSTDSAFDVIDAGTEQVFFRAAEAKEADMSRAVGAAREAFDRGPWPRLTHAQRAEYLRAISAGITERLADFSQIWPRQSGILHKVATFSLAEIPPVFDYYAGLATDFAFEERVQASPSGPKGAAPFGLLVREPVGVVGAIIPWNGPHAADRLQAGAGAAGGLHGDPQGLPGGPG